MNNIQDAWQLNSILDIYNHNGYDYKDKLNSLDYYIHHNTINNGVVLSDKITTVGGHHKISNTVKYYEGNTIDYDYSQSNNINAYFYPLLSVDTYTYASNVNEIIDYDNINCSYNNMNYYKLISAKDIDYENAYLKYAYQTSKYNEPIEYYNIYKQDGELKYDLIQNNDYIFNREITSYINSTYDLLNIVDYLFNRMNCFYFLLNVIKDQRNTVRNASTDITDNDIINNDITNDNTSIS